jgi:hypothetical protein
MTCKKCPCLECKRKLACWEKKRCKHESGLCVIIYNKHKVGDKKYAEVMDKINSMREAERIMGGASINLNHKDYAVTIEYIKPCKVEYLKAYIREGER